MKNAIILAFFMATMPMVAVAQQLSDSVYESFLKTESIEILDDHLSVEVVGVKLALMRFVVARDVQLVVMNNDGMAQLNELTLPEPLDQFCIQHCPSIQFRKRVFDEVKIDSMAFWKRVNGQFDRYPMHCVYEKNQILSHELRIGNIGSYRVSVDGLKPGDTIRLFYSLNFPFNANWTDLFSLRMFHHSSWPRRQYSLSWKYNQRLDVDTTFYKARPAVSVNSGLVNFEWNMKNLPGALDEPNAHPYCDLPWFVFSPKPADLLRLQYTTFDQEYIPAWMMMSALRENDVIAAKVAVNQGVRTPDFSAFNRLADTMMQKFPDDQSGRQVLSWFQKFMVDEVRYDSDIEYYKNHVNYLRDKPGRDLAGRLLRDRNRLTAYSNMILRLHLQFLTAFPMDKRCGIISPK